MKNFAAFRRLPVVVKSAFLLQQMQFILKCREKANLLFFDSVGRHSSVGIPTGYGLDGPGIESLWGRDFPHPSRPTLDPIQSPIQ